jgi:hypothetical protein
LWAGMQQCIGWVTLTDGQCWKPGMTATADMPPSVLHRKPVHVTTVPENCCGLKQAASVCGPVH